MKLISSEFASKVVAMTPALTTLTKRFTRNRDESFDLVQDTVLRALTYRERFRDDTNLNGWLFTIMRNTYINSYKKKTRNRTDDRVDKDLAAMRLSDSHTFSLPDASLEYHDMISLIHSLSADLAAPFKMYLRGFKYHEISACLEIPLGTVKNRIFQARQEIQRSLGQ